jgi:thiamine biosynthesis lipoprotein
MSQVTSAQGTDLRASFRSMASEIRFWIHRPNERAQDLVGRARELFDTVAASCTRFDPDSALMRANAAATASYQVPRECFEAISAAYDAYSLTNGLFDPRTIEVLTQLGYGASLPFESERISLTSTGVRSGARVRAWKPRFDQSRLTVRVGEEPIDLGGIGKGLAVRWASQILHDAGDSVLVEAGGDVMAVGGGPDGDGWMISVEDPFGGADPVAVLRLNNQAVATSSVRVRSWLVDGEMVHHLVDPRTRRPAQSHLRAVSVVHPDPALAEVWSKSLFIAGRSEIRRMSDERGLASLWVDVDGRVTTSRAMREYVAWQVAHVQSN